MGLSRPIPIAVLALAAAMAMLTAAGLGGIERGDEMAGGTGLLQRQAMWLVVSAAVGLSSLAVPYRALRGWTLMTYSVCLVLLGAVYFFPPRNGARRWIPLGLFDFQPSELAKLAYILALSEFLMFRKNHRRLKGLVVPLLMTLIPVALILREPDLGTALLFFPVLFAVLLTAGARTGHLAAALAAGLACLPLLWSLMSAEQKSRITVVFQQRWDGRPATGDGYHLFQSKQVLALGGPWGSDIAGMPVSDPAAYRLPAARTDFIFCLIGERWGLAGTAGLLGLYAVVALCGLKIAASTREPFGRLLAAGITTLVVVQALINMAMTVGLAPITGVTLPLVSYGGSSLLSTTFALALVMNVGMRPGYEVADEPFRFESAEPG